MLEELALTPQIFDPPPAEAMPDWGDQLLELARRVCPEEGLVQLMVADLYDGSWRYQLPNADAVRAIADHRVRRKLQDAIRAVMLAVVKRPPAGDWPDEESGWLSESLASHRRAQFERIIATSSAAQHVASDVARVVSPVEAVSGAHVWRSIRASRSVSMVLAQQLEQLRSITLHSEWLAYTSPYALGNEERFTYSLLEASLRRPEGFRPPRLLEVNSAMPEDAERLASKLDYWKRKVSRLGLNGCRLRLCFHPKDGFRERVVLAGSLAGDFSAPEARDPKWGLCLTHVVLGTDQPEEPPAQWTLLHKEQRFDWRRRLASPSHTLEL